MGKIIKIVDPKHPSILLLADKIINEKKQL